MNISSNSVNALIQTWDGGDIDQWSSLYLGANNGASISIGVNSGIISTPDIHSNDWSNVSITKSQISNYPRTYNSSYQCSGTDKLSNMSIINGNITGVCTADQSGGGSSPTVLNETWKIEQEFLTSSASLFDPFLGTAISSGTISAGSGDMLHMGLIGLRDSTTANGGYRIMTDITAFLLSGNENATFVFRQNTARGNITYRMGFLDTTTIALPTDGCYIQVNGSATILNLFNLTGICRSNNVQTQTTNYITLSNLQWYTAKIDTDATASNVYFSLYDFGGTLLWNGTVSSNIPVTTGRETGFGVIANEWTTDAAADIIQIDYMKLQIYNRTTLLRNAYTSSANIKLSQEFLTGSASSFDPFLGTAISSGLITGNTGTANHLGVIYINDSTTAQGGYRIMTDATAFLLSGNETATFVFKQKINNRNESVRMGWQDSTAINTMPTDGCYFNSSWQSTSIQYIRGVCRSNNVQTNTTFFSVSNNTWYTGKIIMDLTASSVNFSLFNESNYMVWNATVSSNIPVTTGRETGFGIIAGEGTTDATKEIVSIDYMDFTINRGMVR
jgi:hypothetical protein